MRQSRVGIFLLVTFPRVRAARALAINRDTGDTPPANAASHLKNWAPDNRCSIGRLMTEGGRLRQLGSDGSIQRV